MGWVFSVGFILCYMIFKESIFLIAAGLFAIAGSLSIWLHAIDEDLKEHNHVLESFKDGLNVLKDLFVTHYLDPVLKKFMDN